MEPISSSFKAIISASTQEFLDQLSPKERASVTRQIELLELFGTQLSYPHVRHIKDKTWELRARCNRKIFRLFYYIDENRNIHINYSFRKTSDQIPKKHKKQALKRTKH